MNRIVRLISLGGVIVTGALVASRYWLEPPEAWSVTQGRMALIARAIEPVHYRMWDSIVSQQLVWEKQPLVLHDEWGQPFRYRFYGRPTSANNEEPGNKRSRIGLIGEQVLDPSHPKMGKWTKGGWEGGGAVWEKLTSNGSRIGRTMDVEHVELVSYGRDGKPGGRGEDSDVVLRMYESQDYDVTGSRKGESRTWTRKAWWYFCDHPWCETPSRGSDSMKDRTSETRL